MRWGCSSRAGRAVGLGAAFLLVAGAPAWSQAPVGATLCRKIHAITSPAELDGIRNDLAGCYRLAADIDLAGIALRRSAARASRSRASLTATVM